jgi:tRNA-2-methylthio-N6-dimethylallyladenosine synthase
MRGLASVCEHLHMPAQSGSTDVLARMNRGYSREQYVELVREAREVVAGIALVSDFIVGFPGETEDDFRETLSLVETCRFAGSFVFKYSPRRGTKAAAFTDDVPAEVKRRRNRELLEVQERISARENAAFIGRSVEVLVEGPSRTRKDRLAGRARDNRIVIIDEDRSGSSIGRRRTSAGDFAAVEITSSTALALYGRTVQSPPP